MAAILVELEAQVGIASPMETVLQLLLEVTAGTVGMEEIRLELSDRPALQLP